MKILWWSNAPHANTGYGKQTRETVVRLQRLGHEVAVAANFGLYGSSIEWGGIPIYPVRSSPFDAALAGSYAKHFGADLVISLYDLWCLPEDTRQKLNKPWMALIPVDGEPIPPAVVRRARSLEYPVAYSRHAKQLFDQAGVEAVYIPHGVDTGVFRPARDREAVRAQLGVPPETYLVAMVAANKGYPPRKSWPEALEAFARFYGEHSEARLYLHTTRKPHGSEREGVYFDSLLEALGLPRKAVTFADETEMMVGVPDEQMAMIYQASDVLLSPSMGEGFCLPVAEAQACGCPVVTMRCSALGEITINGIATEPLQRLWIPPLAYWWQLASVEKVYMALGAIYSRSRSTSSACAVAGISFIHQRYNWDMVMETYWKPILERIEGELW